MFDFFQMIPRPIYRWKLFWFGMLVVGFLGWAWVRSMGYIDVLTIEAGDHRWVCTFTGGKISVDHSSEGPASSFEVALDSEKGSGFDRRWFPPAIEGMHPAEEMLRELKERTDLELSEGLREELREELLRMMRDSGYDTIWMVAWWFVMLVFLVAWGACLVWRWRRVRRLTEEGR